ncbi:MAG TPA: 4-hydroxyphenylacetate 3-hydroxylase N-terminal domain-containing protein [Chloroflexota bacterium]|jgi:aromatic ring hydroxylase
MGARTGEDYVSALRDGRRVYHAGQRIDDVTTHPGFTGTIRTLARLYDQQHDPAYADLMTTEWQGDRISWSYVPAVTSEDLAAKRRNIEVWSEATLGHMGRFPDFCSELATGLLDAAPMLGAADPRFAENARSYHRYAARRDLCLTHSLNDQYYDRTKNASEQDDPDLILHVVRETADGPIVRGLRNLATLAPIAEECLVYPNRPRAPGELDYAITFAIPLNAPGLSIICRDLYAAHADPERLPLTCRFDEVDATLIFDDVLVPWERVFVYRDVKLAAGFHRAINLWGTYCTLVRLQSRLETFVGVAELLTQWSQRAPLTATQVMMGRLIEDLQLLRACLRAAEADAQPTPRGYLVPRLGEAARLHSIVASDRAFRLLQDLLTSYLMLTGGASDLASPEIGAYVERYFRGGAPTTRDHLRILAVAADMVQSAFGVRQQLYERFQSGEPDNTRLRLYTNFDRAALADRMLRFVRDEW